MMEDKNKSLSLTQKVGWLKSIFTQLESARSLLDLQIIVAVHGWERQMEDVERKYPRLTYTISLYEIEQLRQAGILNEQNQLQWQKMNSQNALSKLLVSLIWKNGDLAKIQLIIDGICSMDSSNSSQNLIFKQFGRRLSDHIEPIADQHVLRAFGCWKAADEEAFERHAVKSVYKNDSQVLMNAYKDWYADLTGAISLDERIHFSHLLDRILFLVGKQLKSH